VGDLGKAGTMSTGARLNCQLLRNFTFLLSLCLTPALFGAAPSSGWIPARWDGGPAEAARRAADKAVATDGPVRQAILQWYDPATLGLLEGTPINCLLLTFSAGQAADVEARQRELVKAYVREAHTRGMAVLGIVYPAGDPQEIGAAAGDAQLDGLVLDGDFRALAGFPAKIESALRQKNSSAVVIPIERTAGAIRNSKAPLVAVDGVPPIARDTSDMGIEAGVSAEPWIDSNIWLVRALRQGTAWRPVWISQQPKSPARGDYLTAVADAAAGGGRWIVTLDDELRSGLFRKDANALATWKAVAGYLKFAEEHAAWRDFTPFGNVGIIIDKASKSPAESDEVLNLTARRQVPYRVIDRSSLNAAVLREFRAVVPADLSPATDAEKQLLRAFVEQGGTVFAGSWWGGVAEGQDYVETHLGKGVVVVYGGDPPNPEDVARELRDMLPAQTLGFTPFNVPSLITYVSAGDGGKRKLIQLVNYASRAFEYRVTLRIEGTFHAARLYSPEGPVVNVEVHPARVAGQTELSMPRLNLWSVLELE
jgi:hypothetical protein